jgi:aspartate ammonia-lyase
MADARIERDSLGELAVPADALYGIHTVRAVANVAVSGRRVHAGLIHAFGAVKLACCQVNRELGHLDVTVAGALEQACRELERGELDAHILVDALQGGAGTSTNMNVNEVLANRALGLLGHAPGTYAVIDPLAHVNLHQSTNDTYPTALRVAALRGLAALEAAVVAAQEACQGCEKRFAHIVKVGRTECQDAVLTTLGRSFGAYGDALARDRWRVMKCAERLRVVNLGGTAIGTGLGAPRRFIFRATDVLRAHTGLPLARAENLVEATANQDALAETSGILKALALDLLKLANDLRWMSSGPDAGLGELRLAPLQAGSSIMPGKVNPVVPEAVVQAALQAIADDAAITAALGHGGLELHPFLPLVADRLLSQIDLLTAASRLLADRCLGDLAANEVRCAAQVRGGTAAVTAVAGIIGYHAAAEAAAVAIGERRALVEVLEERGLMSAADFAAAIAPEAVMRLGSPEVR